MPENLRVLVVDDMATTRELMFQTLDVLGVRQVRTVCDGNAALAALAKDAADLVISDLHMPDMDGIELYRRIKQDEGLNGTQFVLATSDNALASLPEGYRLGGHRMLRKPYTPQTLLQCLEDAAARKASPAPDRKAADSDA